MASRSHVDMRVTSEVIERRLRPVYDCLDNGNNKKAIQEADKVLKKQKDLQCAKVLKALALLRLGRHDDSSVMLQEVHSQHPTDEATLQAMAICYREIHKLDMIADMYENAHKSRPDNEEILTALFMAYVRLGNHKKQQQTAMILHKLKPQKNPYYFWAVMSIVMQAHNSLDNIMAEPGKCFLAHQIEKSYILPHAHNSSDDGLAKKMFLPLAERMTKKYVDDGKIEAEAEVQMYLIILELLEKWEDALKLIEGPLGEKLVTELNFRETKAAELYMKLEKWSKANSAYRKLLKENPDHIFWWKEYIKSMKHLTESQWKPSDEESDCVDHTPVTAQTFIQETIDNCSDRPIRGPYLAQLELIKQLQSSTDKPQRNYGDPLALFQNYYDKFGDRFCCFGDLKSYVSVLTPEEATKFLSSIGEKSCQPSEDGAICYAKDIKEMQRHITVLQLSRILGAQDKLTKEEKIDLAKDLLDRHKHGLDFGKDLLSTDLQFSDAYLLMAVTLLLDVWQVHEDSSIVWQIIVILELGLKYSPSNFQMKLLLIRLYCTVGAFGPCPVLYDGMEIKHIMNDTLGHIVSNHVGRLGQFMAACAMYGTMLRFFTVNHKETTEYLIASYKYGSFTKINEFVKFRTRLQNSLQYSCATAERMLLDLVLETNSHLSTEQMVMYMEINPEKETATYNSTYRESTVIRGSDKTVYNELCDNRDFTVMSNWEPPSRFTMSEVQEQSFKEEVAWLKVRELTLRILAASVMLGQEIDHDHHTNNGVTDDGKKPIHTVLSDLQDQLSSHVNNCQCYTQETKYPVQGPFRTRLCRYLQGDFHKLFLAMLDNVDYIHTLQDDGIDKIDNEREEKLKNTVPSIANDLIQRHKCSLLNESDDRKSLNCHILENLVLCAEAIAHITVLVGVCYRMLKPVKTVLARRNKKKKGNIIPLPCTFDNFNVLVASLEKISHDLHMSVLDLDPLFLSLDLNNLHITDTFCADEEYKAMETEMWRKVEKSYQQSVVEVTEFLHKKMQYLNSLRL